ncbi:MAG: hypothetical protein WC735_02380 [Candidatus Paceibacterota bacterium]|jgi:hypothetical protein
MKNLQKGSVVPLLISIIALLVIGGGGYLIYKSKKAEAPAVVDIGTQQTNTSNWKTYTNVKYGFEFKYPVSLEIENNDRYYPDAGQSKNPLEKSNFVTIFDPLSSRNPGPPHQSHIVWRDQFSVFNIQVNQTSKEYAQYAYDYNNKADKKNSEYATKHDYYQYMPSKVTNLSETKVGNYEGSSFECETMCSVIPSEGFFDLGGKHKVIYLSNDKNIVALLVTDKPIFNKILSTFKFTK